MARQFAPFALAPALAAALAAVQPHPAAAQPVVQAIPPPALADLQAALRILATRPEDYGALLRAGMASLELDDPQAALGFFRRAQAVNPASGEVKAGLASVELRQGNPIEAIRLFAEAEAAGAPMARFAGDRGLALDLVGSNLAAQQYYRQALALENDPEVLRRLALSQAIAGDQNASEFTLLPLLQRTDLAAYRTRAFALAILGKSDEAVSIAETMLPGSLSNRIAPYLRYMPRLTRAQQAAAANLGRFPAAGEIGRDSPEIAAIAGEAGPPQVAARTPDARLEPAGRPLGSSAQATRRSRERTRAQPQPQTRQAAPVPPAAPPPAEQPQNEPEPVGVAAAEPPPSEPEPRAVLVAAVEDAPPPAAEAVPEPSFSISAPVAAEPEAAGESLAGAPLAEAFAGFSLPPGESARPAGGAVDIASIDPPRERPRAAEPPPSAHPRRYWVQVATGRDTSALAFDWRRIKRSGGDLLANREAFTADWGQTHRLVTGPYPSAAAAQQAVTDLKARGLDTFAFTSAEGEVVSPLR